MKKRLLSLILCIYLLVSPVLELSAFGTEPEAPAAEAEVTAPVETDTLQWMSYNEFLQEEYLRAWDYPSMFVGSEAVFSDRYKIFEVAPNPDYIYAAFEAELAKLAAQNAALTGEGAVEETASEEAASEEAAPPMLPEETDGASSGGSESEEAPEGEIITEPAVLEDALTEPVIDEQPAAAEDEAAEGEELVQLVDEESHDPAEAALVADGEPEPLGVVHLPADGAHGGEARGAQHVERDERAHGAHVERAGDGEHAGKSLPHGDGVLRGAAEAVQDAERGDEVLLRDERGDGGGRRLPVAEAEWLKQPRYKRANIL